MASGSQSKPNTFQRIRQLNRKSSIALCAALLSRMHINYQLFTELTGFGDPQVGKNIINLLWENVQNPKAKINAQAQSEKIESETPDVTQFDNYGVFPALDFCMAVQAALELVSGEDEQAAVTVSKLSQGGTESYISVLEGKELSGRELKEHELMAFEIDVQNHLIDLCEMYPIDISELQAFLKDDLVSNIGLSQQ